MTTVSILYVGVADSTALPEPPGCSVTAAGGIDAIDPSSADAVVVGDEFEGGVADVLAAADGRPVVVYGDYDRRRLRSRGVTDYFDAERHGLATAMRCAAGAAREGDGDRAGGSDATDHATATLTADGGRKRAVEGPERPGSRNTDWAAQPFAEVDGASSTLKERAMDEAPVGITISDPGLPDNQIIYANEAFERVTGYPATDVIGRNCRFLQGPDTNPEAVGELRAAVEERESVAVELENYRRSGERFWNRVEITPITGESGKTYFVGYQTDVTERKQAELEAQRRAEELYERHRQLERVLARVRGLVSDVARVVAESTDTEELEARVCERFAAADTYTGAWIGRREFGADRIVARTQVGCGIQRELAVPSSSDGEEPVGEALETGRVVVADVDDLQDDSPHASAAEPGGGVAALPLQNAEARHGVLCVYARSSDAVDHREVTVLESLASTITTGISAIASQRHLEVDEHRRLRFRSRDRNLPYVALSGRLDAVVEYKSVVSKDDGSQEILCYVDGADGEAIATAAAELGIDPVAIVSSVDDGCLVEFTVPTEESVIGTVVASGGQVRSITATSGTAELVVTFPVEIDIRAIVSELLSQYPETELTAQWTESRSPTPGMGFVEEVDEELTNRQFDALSTAYLGGYYDWPRETTGETLASTMGIDGSTYHQHLRTAERKLVRRFFRGSDRVSVD